MDWPVSDSLKDLLVRQGMHGNGGNRTHAEKKDPVSCTTALNGVSWADAPREEGTKRRPPAERGGAPTDLNARMRKAARYTRNGAALLMLVVSDVR